MYYKFWFDLREIVTKVYFIFHWASELKSHRKIQFNVIHWTINEHRYWYTINITMIIVLAYERDLSLDLLKKTTDFMVAKVYLIKNNQLIIILCLEGSCAVVLGSFHFQLLTSKIDRLFRQNTRVAKCSWILYALRIDWEDRQFDCILWLMLMAFIVHESRRRRSS